MNEFQITSASLAIILEVFSEDSESNSAASANSSVALMKMQKRVAKGEFWECMGGLDVVEKSLIDGFNLTFHRPRYDNHGKRVFLAFPHQFGELFRVLRSCGESKDAVKPSARAVLPILRNFVAEIYNP